MTHQHEKGWVQYVNGMGVDQYVNRMGKQDANASM